MAVTETRKAGFGFSETGWLKPNEDPKSWIPVSVKPDA
jgi:hypothetical protein